MLRITFYCVLIDFFVVSCLAIPHSKQFNDHTCSQMKITTPNPDPTLRIDYTESYEPERQPRIRRAAVMDVVEIENTTISEVMSLINDIITKNKDDVITALDLFNTKSDTQLTDTNSVCTAKEYEHAGIFKESLKNWMTSIIIGRKKMLSSIQINDLLNINGTISNTSSISDLKLKNIVIKGIENIIISKYDMDLCEMSTEVEFKVPNIQITTMYTLKGIIDGDPVVGDGNLRVDVEGMYFNGRSVASCDKDDIQCKSHQKNKTSIANTDSIKVNVTGIKYRDFGELKINEEINEYIKNGMETAVRSRIMNILVDNILKQEKPSIQFLLPVYVHEELKENIIALSVPYNDNSSRCLLSIQKILKSMHNFYK